MLETLGAVDTEVFSRLLRQILDKNVTGAIQVIDGMVIEGREMGQFVTDFTWYLRNLLLVQSSDNMEDVLDISADNPCIVKRRSGNGRSGNLNEIHPYFFRTQQSDQICNAEAYFD